MSIDRAEIEQLLKHHFRFGGYEFGTSPADRMAVALRDLLARVDELEAERAERDALRTERQQLIESNGRLVTQVEALRRDAERYQWLRGDTTWRGSVDNYPWCIMHIPSHNSAHLVQGDTLDAAIDAAIQQSREVRM